MADISPEVVTALTGIHEGSGIKSHKIVVQSASPLVETGDDRKSRILSGVSSESRVREVHLIERYDNVDTYIEKWEAFKKAGLPVVPTVRKTDRGTLLMTDLKADGSQLYGKSLANDFKKVKMGMRASARNPLDDVFLDLAKNQMKDITRSAVGLSDKAAAKGIIISEDDPFELVVHPDGTWQIMMLDLVDSTVNLRIDINNTYDNASNNFRYTQKFLNELKFIKKELEPDKKLFGLGIFGKK